MKIPLYKIIFYVSHSGRACVRFVRISNDLTRQRVGLYWINQSYKRANTWVELSSYLINSGKFRQYINLDEQNKNSNGLTIEFLPAG